MSDVRDTDGTDLNEEVVAAEVLVEQEAATARRVGVGPFRRLYRGLTSFDFVGRRRIWFGISAVIIAAGMLALGIRGLNLGIDFKGGSTWEVKVENGVTVTQAQAASAIAKAGLPQPVVEILSGAQGEFIQVQSDLKNVAATQRDALTTKVVDILARLAHVKDPNKVASSFVGPTWGGEITKKAIEALVAFFVAVLVYISFRFEPKMAIAAFLAMLHDLAVTIGVYAIFGFQVTPDTVIAVLTILGYSLYDTVVVFDRVRDNTKPFAASGRMTYSAMVNLSMNQTLARSINTSMVAILPVLSVLLVGAEVLGAITLQAYGVALTVGLLSGAYSSIFIASPLLAITKEREQRYRAIRARLQSKGDRLLSMSATDAARFLAVAPAGAATGSGPVRPRPTPRTPTPSGPAPRPPRPDAGAPPAVTTTPTRDQSSVPIIQPRARKQKRR